MSKVNEWKISTDEGTYTISYTFIAIKGKHILKVNEDIIDLKKSNIIPFVGIDQPINIGGKECRIVIIGNKADVVVEGMYLESKKPYIPLKRIPYWVLIFIVLCFAIPVVTLGGALPVVIAVFGSLYCIRVAISPNMKISFKILSCLGITALAWLLLGMLVFSMSS